MLVGHLVHFTLCFALHINELLKLHYIIFFIFETKIEGVAMQADNWSTILFLYGRIRVSEKPYCRIFYTAYII